MDLATAVGEARRSAGIPALAAIRVSSAAVEEVALDGVRRNDRPKPIALDDRFHLGSNAKAITALVAAMAVEEHRIGWDTSAADVLGVGTPPLHQLLTHNAGLHPYGEDEEIARVAIPDGTPMEQRAAFARTVLTEAPLHEPGARHEYSNAGFVTAAAMVETVTGEPWEDAIQARVFRPLGIDARVGWPANHGEAPLGHWLQDGKLTPHDPATDPYALAPAIRPAGDVSMAPNDYGLFLADQLAGLSGRGKLGSAELYRTVHTPDPPDEPGDVGYALGWGVRETENGPTSMHTGSADTFYAVVVLQPAADRGIALLANSALEEHMVAINTIAKDFFSGKPEAQARS